MHLKKDTILFIVLKDHALLQEEQRRPVFSGAPSPVMATMQKDTILFIERLKRSCASSGGASAIKEDQSSRVLSVLSWLRYAREALASSLNPSLFDH
uniref:Uncharacterized protein n=1 Tax=Steinernema glaseri TaxID=37863 RepID=A0A1I8A588_9BILA